MLVVARLLVALFIMFAKVYMKLLDARVDALVADAHDHSGTPTDGALKSARAAATFVAGRQAQIEADVRHIT